MKIKGLLLGMFACAALVACTNDDIVENNNIEQPEKVKANLTLSISTSTGSGRAADAETGDDVENGTPSEGSIKDAVIIISPVQGNTATGLVEYADNITVTSGVYEPSFQLYQTGSYNVLVILNPCADIANKAKETSATAAGVYEYVTNYSITAGSSNDASVDVVTKGASARDHFMMANSEAAMVNITSQDSTQPIIQAIRVERVVSKITFTPNNNDNKYNVKVKVTTIPTVTTDGWLKTTTADKTSYIYITKLNKALLDADNAEIWVLLNGGNETGRYQLESTLDNKYKGNVKQNETTTSIEAPVFVATDRTGAFHYEKGTSTTAEETWTVYLDKYAMVNLSKTVYAVRHKTSDWSTISPFGTLTNSDYLVDPKSVDKNSVTLTDGLWADGDKTATDYFFNTVGELQTSQDIYNNAFLKDLPKSSDVEIGEIAQSNDAFLTYCLENSVTKDHQQKGVVTGIVFRGEILDNEGTNVGTIYKYANQYFRSKDALRSVYPAYKAENLVTYTDGYCYYYAPIEHFKGNENNMQYAIMRNNIYSLKIGTFKEIGSSTIIPEDGGTIDDESAYLKLTTTIAPWIVRFNTVNF